MAGDEDSFGGALRAVREKMTPEQQAKLDASLRGAVERAMSRLKELDQVVSALGLLHRAGLGDRAGFCNECGNVVPCQTRKFLEPYLPR